MRAFFGESERCGAADAAGCAGDERDPIFKFFCHGT
jgi:hypothetical protein